MVAVLAGVLAMAASASAQGIGSSAGGGLPGGTLSTTPGVGGVGVPGQVAGGTLSTKPGVGGVGVPAQVPGGTLGTSQPCGTTTTECERPLFIPGLVVPVPAGDSGSSAAEGGEPSDGSGSASASP